MSDIKGKRDPIVIDLTCPSSPSSSSSASGQEPLVLLRPPMYDKAQRDAWKAARDAHYATRNQDELTEDHLKEYLDKAIPKPPDGENAKKYRPPSGESSCLTCILLSKVCHGAEVVDGKCETCRKSKRRCLWLDPAKDIYNHPDAFAAGGFSRNEYNTVAGRAARQIARHQQEQASKVRPTAPESLKEIFDLPNVMLVLRDVVPGLDLEDITDDNARLSALFDAFASHTYLPGDINTFSERLPRHNALSLVVHTLHRMHQVGNGVTAQEIMSIVEG